MRATDDPAARPGRLRGNVSPRLPLLARGLPARRIEELLGHHLEQAFLHRRDLGRFDAAGRGLAVRAGERLAGAGLRAYGRFDLPAAENLLSRAKPLLPVDHPQRTAVLRRLAETYPPSGRPAEADAVFVELLDEVGVDASTRFARGIRLERARIRLITGSGPGQLGGHPTGGGRGTRGLPRGR